MQKRDYLYSSVYNQRRLLVKQKNFKQFSIDLEFVSKLVLELVSMELETTID